MSQSLSGWTDTQLVKFVKKVFDENPPGFIPQATIDELAVVKLIVEDQLLFAKGAKSDWHIFGQAGAPAFTNAWVWDGVGYPPAVWKDPFGIVRLRGTAKTGTIGTSIATLGPGFRPNYPMRFPVESNGALGVLLIGTDGTLTAAVGSNVRFSLDGIHFKP
jgi:hypothetical protein